MVTACAEPANKRRNRAADSWVLTYCQTEGEKFETYFILQLCNEPLQSEECIWNCLLTCSAHSVSGRCVKENNSNYPLNCSLDVKPEMDSYCSGRQRCDVRIDDANFRRLTPCHRDLKVHLWASYQCRKGNKNWI
jgi:hypothetical protein